MSFRESPKLCAFRVVFDVTPEQRLLLDNLDSKELKKNLLHKYY